MAKGFAILLVSATMLLPVTGFRASAEVTGEHEILAVVRRMISEFEKADDFTCETEVTYYKGGEKDQQWRVKFFYTKEKQFRVDFSYPYKGMSVFYKGGDEELTVRPFGFFPALKFRLSIHDPIARTPSGQRIDQTDVGYFIRFIFNNRETIRQRRNEFHEEEERIAFSFWALDYIDGKHPEKYRVFVSKEIWFPLRVERYDREGGLLELIVFRNHAINSHLEDTLFLGLNPVETMFGGLS
jgi:outer membrane lipoprotein-sorting protein